MRMTWVQRAEVDAERARARERDLRDREQTDDELAQYDRPRTRGDCVDAPRPCPWVSCRHHLALEVSEAGGIKLAFLDREVWEMTETCSLDVADRAGEPTLEEVGAVLNVTRERIRQLESRALRIVKRYGARLER